MRCPYYNINENRYINQLAKQNPYLAIEEYETYIKKYPKDYITKIQYAMTLISIREFDLASEIIERIESDGFNDHYQDASQKKALRKLKESLSCAKLKLMIYQEKYQEAYEFLLSDDFVDQKNRKNPNESYYSRAILFCEKELGLPITEQEISPYIEKIILTDQEEPLKTSLVNHSYEFAMQKNGYVEYFFRKEFPMDEVIKELKRVLPSEEGFFTGTVEDSYFIRFDQCGYHTKNIVNYFEVICLHNTNKIITMCPTANKNPAKYIDFNHLNALKTEEEKPKQKSRIERFNQRYGLN